MWVRSTPHAAARLCHCHSLGLTSISLYSPVRGSRLNSTWEMPRNRSAPTAAAHRPAPAPPTPTRRRGSCPCAPASGAASGRRRGRGPRRPRSGSCRAYRDPRPPGHELLHHRLVASMCAYADSSSARRVAAEGLAAECELERRGSDGLHEHRVAELSAAAATASTPEPRVARLRDGDAAGHRRFDLVALALNRLEDGPLGPRQKVAGTSSSTRRTRALTYSSWVGKTGARASSRGPGRAWPEETLLVRHRVRCAITSESRNAT